MLDQSTRTAILRLREEGHGARAIARTLGISRGAVKTVFKAGSEAVPHLDRAELAEPLRDDIIALYASCKANLVRVHQELAIKGATLSYQALTAFCRRHAIGRAPKPPAGRYEFEPGVEMQHDTSPHFAIVAGRRVHIESTSLVLGYSRMIFLQCYPHFTRFTCKIFLTDAAQYFGGVCARCMIDNTHVVVRSGSGKNMVAVPEMIAFADRFGFEFVAHEIGDANRSAKVERNFDFIDHNFLAGRTFTDWDDLNAQARAWSDKVNATPRRALHASPRELFATELLRLKALPLHVPEVYRLHHRIVDVEGYVHVLRVRYSAPWRLIGRPMEVRESRDRIEIFDGPRLVAEHRRATEACDQRITDPAHRPPRGALAQRVEAPEKRRLLERDPAFTDYVTLLHTRGRGSVREIRTLTRMLDEYPADALHRAIAEATRFGMTDLARLERMILRRIAGDFFPPPTLRTPPTADEESDD